MWVVPLCNEDANQNIVYDNRRPFSLIIIQSNVCDLKKVTIQNNVYSLKKVTIQFNLLCVILKLFEY